MVYRMMQKSGEAFAHCQLEDQGRIAAIPEWMLDPARCATLRLSETPYVCWEALRALKTLLREVAKGDMVEHWHQSLNPEGDADANANTTALSPGRTVESVLPPSRKALVGNPADLCAAEDYGVVKPDAARASKKPCSRKPRKRGVR